MLNQSVNGKLLIDCYFVSISGHVIHCNFYSETSQALGSVCLSSLVSVEHQQCAAWRTDVWMWMSLRTALTLGYIALAPIGTTAYDHTSPGLSPHPSCLKHRLVWGLDASHHLLSQSFVSELWIRQFRSGECTNKITTNIYMNRLRSLFCSALDDSDYSLPNHPLTPCIPLSPPIRAVSSLQPNFAVLSKLSFSRKSNHAKTLLTLFDDMKITASLQDYVTSSTTSQLRHTIGCRHRPTWRFFGK